jgi:hypothetical protein
MAISIVVLLFSMMIFWLRLFNKKAFWGEIVIDFPLFYMMGAILYLIIPAAIILFNGNISHLDLMFITDIVLLSTCILIGSIVGTFVAFNYVKNGDFKRSQQKLLVLSNISSLIIVGFIAILLYYYLIKVYGTVGGFFTQQYGNFEAGGINSFTSFFPFLLCGLILTFNSKYVIFPTFGKSLILITSLIVCGIFLLGGNRNIAVMYFFAICLGVLYGNKINIYKVLILLLIGIVFAAILAVFREYGIVNILFGEKVVEFDDVLRYVFAVNEGEFGTVYRVSKYYDEFSFLLEGFSGYSYILSPIVNLIPTALYPGRPDTLAVDFTMQYWASKPTVNNDFVIGLGFSPILEAKVNFSDFWYSVFIIIGIITSFLYQVKLKSINSFHLYCFWGSLSVVCLNFYRIDFALFFKFFMLIYLVSFFTYKFIWFLKYSVRLPL